MPPGRPEPLEYGPESVRRLPPTALSPIRRQPPVGHRWWWPRPPAVDFAGYLAGRIPARRKKMRRSAIYRAHPAAERRGFTLIELVTVITIAGVMAAYFAPRFWNQQTFSDRGYVDELAG